MSMAYATRAPEDETLKEAAQSLRELAQMIEEGRVQSASAQEERKLDDFGYMRRTFVITAEVLAYPDANPDT